MRLYESDAWINVFGEGDQGPGNLSDGDFHDSIVNIIEVVLEMKAKVVRYVPHQRPGELMMSVDLCVFYVNMPNTHLRKNTKTR